MHISVQLSHHSCQFCLSVHIPLGWSRGYFTAMQMKASVSATFCQVRLPAQVLVHLGLPIARMPLLCTKESPIASAISATAISTSNTYMLIRRNTNKWYVCTQRYLFCASSKQFTITCIWLYCCVRPSFKAPISNMILLFCTSVCPR